MVSYAFIEDLIVTVKVQSPFVQKLLSGLKYVVSNDGWWFFVYAKMTTVSLLTDLTSETNHFVKVKCWKYACCAYIYLTENKVLLFIKGL